MSLAKVVIDISTDTAKLVSGMNKAEKTVKRTVNSIKSNIKTLITAYAGVATAQKVLSDGYAFNKSIETATAGLTALTVATSKNVDSLGNALTITQKYNLANIESNKTMKELLRINASTPHTLSQTNEIYKAMYVSMKKVGASTKDMINLTQKISIAAGSAGIEYNQLLAGVDGLATGTVEANSDFGRFLNSLGLTNEALKNTDDVVKLLNNRFKDFKAVDTMTVSVSNLTNAWDILAGAITKDIFEESKGWIHTLTIGLNNVNKLINLHEIEAKSIDKLISKEDLLYKKKYLVAQENKIINDNSIDIDTKREQLKKLDDQIHKISVKMAGIFKQEDIKLVASYDDKQNQLDIKNILDPYDVELENINQKWKKIYKDQSKNGIDTTNTVKAWSKLIDDLIKKYDLIPTDITPKHQKVNIDNKFDGLDNLYGDLNGDPLSITPTDNLSAWEDYYIKLGDLETAWELKKVQLNKTYGEEAAKKSYDIYHKEFYDKLKKDTQIETFTTTITLDVNNPFDPLIKSIDTLQQEQESYNAIAEKTDKINQQHTQNQLSGYSNMAGAMASFYDSESKQAKNLHKLQDTLAGIKLARDLSNMAVNLAAYLTTETAKQTASTGTAIVSSMAGIPFPLNIAAGLATASFISSILGGGDFGGSSNYSENTIENPNTTTVLGGGDDESKSLNKSMDILADSVKPEFRLLSSMNDHLSMIEQLTAGTAKDIIRTSDYALGVGAMEYTSDWQNSLFGADIFKSVFGLGGGGYDWQKLAGSGLVFGDVNATDGSSYSSSSSYYGDTNTHQAYDTQTLQELIDDTAVMMFQDIANESMSKSWWGHASYSYSSTTSYQDADAELMNSLSLTFKNLNDAIVDASSMLGEDVQTQLSNETIDIGYLDLNGLDSDALTDTLNSAFSEQADIITEDLYKNTDLSDFQQIGEGLFETLTRVGAGIEEANYYIDRLGTSYEHIDFQDIENTTNSDVSSEALKQSIESYDQAVYGINNGVVQMIDTFSGSTDELYDFYVQLEDSRTIMELTGQSAANLNSDMLLGAGGIEAFDDALNSYFDNFLSSKEQLDIHTKAMESEFDKLNISMPTNNAAFESLIEGIDTTTQAGSELYGRVILLADSFDALTQEQTDYFNSIQDNTFFIEDLNTKIADENKQRYEDELDFIKDINNELKDLGRSIDTTISTLIGNTTDENSQDRLIKEYWSNYDKLQNYDLANLDSQDSQDVQDIIGYMNNLAIDIQSSQTGDNTNITNSLIDSLDAINSDISFANDVLDVNIVASNDDAFASLALTDSQKDALSAFLEDGYISSDELATLSLNDTDRQNIEDTADRLGTDTSSETTYQAITTMNDYLATLLDVDNTLTTDDFMLSLGEMSNMSNQDQLLLIQDGFTAQSDATKIDEAQQLTTDYAGYLYSDDQTQYLKDLYDVDQNRFGNVEELADYFNQILEVQDYDHLSDDNKKIIDDFKLSEYAFYNGSYEAYADLFTQNDIDSIYDKSIMDIDPPEIESSSITDKISDFFAKLFGFSDGGFTSGGIDDIAGVVHGGEYVAPAYQVNKYPQLFQQLNNERTGYKTGGFVNNDFYYNDQKDFLQIDVLIEEIKNIKDEITLLREQNNKGQTQIISNTKPSRYVA